MSYVVLNETIVDLIFEVTFSNIMCFNSFVSAHGSCSQPVLSMEPEPLDLAGICVPKLEVFWYNKSTFFGYYVGPPNDSSVVL